MIDCKETLARLYEYLDDELTPDRAAQVAEHLEACRHCFDRAEFERSFGRFMKDAARETVNADPLKSRIKAKLIEINAADQNEDLFPNHDDSAPIDSIEPPPTGISDEELRRMRAYYRQRRQKTEADRHPAAGEDNPPQPPSIPFWSFLLAAAAVILIAVPFIRQYGTDTGKDPMIQALMALHIDSHPEFEESDPSALSQWVSRRTQIDPMVRGLAAIGCTLAGATVDSVWGTQLVHVYAESSGQPLSMMVTTEKEFLMPKGLGVLQLDDEQYWTAEQGDYSLLIWKVHDAGLICIAVAQMPPLSLTELMQRVEAAEEAGTA